MLNIHLVKENLAILSLGQKVIVVLLVYLEGKMNNSMIILFIGDIILFFSPGLSGRNGRDGADGVKGEIGYQGPPGRKVRHDL